MRVRAALVLALALFFIAAPLAVAAQVDPDAARALRDRVQARFDVVPLSDGVALRPKIRAGDVRLVEVSDAGIAVNGVTVTGRELRDRLGADADLVLRLSYLDPSERAALFADAERAEPESSGGRELPPVRELPQAREEGAAPTPPSTSAPPDEFRRSRRARGDRVRVFGGVTVERDERIQGQAVAVFGSARIDGEVGDQVVAVLGNVELGPEAIVHGDIVSVGGRVRRAPGAQVRGGVTEVSLGGADVHLTPWLAGWGLWGPFDGFGAAPRLVLSSMRLLLLVILASIVWLVARTTVERSAQRVTDEPLKSTIVGVLSQLLLIPVLLLTGFILALSIIGIPLLLLMPFAVLFLVLMALAGFTGTAYAVGQWARRRFGCGVEGAWLEVVIGVLLILLPLMLGRLLGVVGWAAGPFALLLIIAGFAVEYLAWASGFGAVLTNAFSRWQARRAARTTPPPPAATPPPLPVE
jgi:hypothetical protein